MTLDDLIAATVAGQIAWTTDTYPAGSLHGQTVFVGRDLVHQRTTRGWVTLGPADDLRRAITNHQARETAQ